MYDPLTTDKPLRVRYQRQEIGFSRRVEYELSCRVFLSSRRRPLTQRTETQTPTQPAGRRGQGGDTQKSRLRVKSKTERRTSGHPPQARRATSTPSRTPGISTTRATRSPFVRPKHWPVSGAGVPYDTTEPRAEVESTRILRYPFRFSELSSSYEIEDPYTLRVVFLVKFVVIFPFHLANPLTVCYETRGVEVRARRVFRPASVSTSSTPNPETRSSK